MVEELKKPKEGSQALHFDTAYSRTYFQQFRWILWKNNITYWRLPQYNGAPLTLVPNTASSQRLLLLLLLAIRRTPCV